ncbi:MAG: T9SS type A sorting domain-containing protein [bacterium]
MRTRCSPVLCFAKILAFITLSVPCAAQSQTTGTPIPGTLDDFEKPNQSKVFFHDGTWWLAARASDANWYLWQYTGSSWEQGILLDTSGKARPDCYVNSPNNKLYIAISHTSRSKFILASYVSGNWSIDAGYPIVIDSLTHDEDNVISFCRDMTGRLWLFRMQGGTVETVYSNDNGRTWSARIPIKTDLNVGYGVTDCVAFKIQENNYVGVAYAENTQSGAVAEYGFLHHKVGDPETNWTDESSEMGQFPGTTADNHIAAIADIDGTIYIVVKTSGGRGNAATNGLYLRDESGWQRFVINNHGSWTRPAITLDKTNNEIIVLGTLEGSQEIGVYKKVPIGAENTLIYATEFVTFENTTDEFKDVSVAAHAVDQEIDLMVAVENSTQESIWYNRIDIIKTTSDVESLTNERAPHHFDLFEVFPNPLTQQALIAGRAIELRFSLSTTGTISVRIYNMLGQRVASLAEHERLVQGLHSFSWNGRNAAGRFLPPGVYFVHVETGRFSATQKILILR